MQAGLLRRRVTLQQPASDVSGGFRDVAPVSAAIAFRPASSVAMAAGGPSASGTYQVRLRYRDDVRAGWRIVEGTRTYQVVGYGDPDGRRAELAVTCTEVQ
jgi:SPP1 family predicted phage head-tail adaptor